MRGSVDDSAQGRLRRRPILSSEVPSPAHQVGTILDVEDVMPGGRYTLEVSSPGLERKLLKPQDYERFQGKKAKISLRDPVEGRRHWEGMLAGFAEGSVTLETEPGITRRFPLEQIQKANLKFEW